MRYIPIICRVPRQLATMGSQSQLSKFTDWHTFTKPLENTCTNCEVYGWKQPEGKVTLRCTGCKLFFYCSKECQQEHWKKTHRQHCKHLAQLKSGERISKHDLDSNLTLLSSATSDPKDRLERLLVIMQRIFYKIERKMLSATPEKDKVTKIESWLLSTRAGTYVDRLINPKMIRMGVLQAPKFPPLILNVKSDSAIIEAYQTFTTLIWLAEEVLWIRRDQILKSPEKSLPPEWREKSKIVREGPFLEILDEIIVAFEDEELPTLSKVASTICGGDTRQNCTMCQEEVDVTRVWYPGRRKPGASVRLCHHEPDLAFVCEKVECRESFDNKTTDTMWGFALGDAYAKLMETRCDFCFLCAPLKEVHRSLCKTKNYCSQGCRDADNSVHKVCCEQGGQVEERKVKTGGKEKTDVALSTVKSYASTCLQELKDRTHLHAKPDYEESVAHFSDLVEKIQLKEDRKLRKVQRLSEVD